MIDENVTSDHHKSNTIIRANDLLINDPIHDIPKDITNIVTPNKIGRGCTTPVFYFIDDHPWIDENVK